MGMWRMPILRLFSLARSLARLPADAAGELNRGVVAPSLTIILVAQIGMPGLLRSRRRCVAAAKGGGPS